MKIWYLFWVCIRICLQRCWKPASKVASELFAPLSGEVVEANDEKLEDEPEYVNEAPYDAWICKIKVADMAEYEALLTAEQYEASLAE